MIPPGSKPSRPPRESKSRRSERSSRPPRGSGDRKSRGKGGPPRGKGRHSARTTYTPKPRPKPLKPLTESMKKGKEPMRTFGDLLQFYEMKKDEGKGGDAEKKKADAPDEAKPAKDKPEDSQP
jgi:uncharacterized protein